MPFAVDTIRKQFPFLSQYVHGNKPLVYFDNAATTQKPVMVLDALLGYYHHSNANVHRSVHVLADRATAGLEATRQAVQQFIHARESAEIIFTAGTTASLNMVAWSYGRSVLQPGDRILLSAMEHHANIVPWQLVAQLCGAHLDVIPIDEKGALVLSAFEQGLAKRPKIVAITYVSNNLGTINPLAYIAQKAHEVGAVVVVDAAQAAPHMAIDVQALDCDFLAFSAHKVYGPTGVGILYGKRALLEAMPPYQGGGEMIRSVTFLQSSYNDIPYKFEAGTPNIANIVAFKAALDFLGDLGWEGIQAHEQVLREQLEAGLTELPGVKLIGTAPNKIAVVSFTVANRHPFDVGMLLDAAGIAVRTGHGCAQPLMHNARCRRSYSYFIGCL